MRLNDSLWTLVPSGLQHSGCSFKGAEPFKGRCDISRSFQPLHMYCQEGFCSPFGCKGDSSGQGAENLIQLMMRCHPDIYCTPTLPLLLQKKIENYLLGSTIPKFDRLLFRVSPAIVKSWTVRTSEGVVEGKHTHTNACRQAGGGTSRIIA